MDEQAPGKPSVELQQKIVTMRDGGASWADVERAFGLTRQQARYAYQLGKRTERRQQRRLD